MPPQRGGRPLNQLVVDNFQQITIPGRLATVQCRHCHKIMYIYINERTLNRPRELKKRLRYTQGIEVDEEELCEMKDRLLQEEIAMTRLNPSSENILNEYLDSVIDGQVLLELPLHGQPAGQIGQLTPY